MSKARRTLSDKRAGGDPDPELVAGAGDRGIIARFEIPTE